MKSAYEVSNRHIMVNRGHAEDKSHKAVHSPAVSLVFYWWLLSEYSYYVVSLSFGTTAHQINSHKEVHSSPLSPISKPNIIMVHLGSESKNLFSKSFSVPGVRIDLFPTYEYSESDPSSSLSSTMLEFSTVSISNPIIHACDTTACRLFNFTWWHFTITSR